MATFYKDFNKEVKDLLTKNFQQVETWQIETKNKGPDATIFVNPQANNHGVSVDVEWNNKAAGVETKTRVDSKGNVKPKVTYKTGDHKVEASIDRALKYEVVYEGKFGKLAVNDKLTPSEAEAAFSFAVAPHCFVGASVAYNISKATLHWSAGTRWSNNGILFDVVTHDLKTYTTGLLAPLTVAGKKITFAGQVACTKGEAHEKVGVELPCILFAGNTLKAHVDSSFKYALTYIAKLPGGWKSALTVDSSLKYGVLFQRE